MRWEDERYVRVYTRDTADWLALSFDAQSLFMHVLRKVDRAGVLDLGRHGKRAVAIAIGHAGAWDRLSGALEELLVDGCVVIEGHRLIIRNYLEAQEARASDRARQREHREKARALSPEPTPDGPKDTVTKRDGQSQNVTESHDRSHDVTRGHAESHAVTPSHAVPNQTEGGSAPARDAVVPTTERVVPAATCTTAERLSAFAPDEALAVMAMASNGLLRPMASPTQMRELRDVAASIHPLPLTLEDFRIFGEAYAAKEALAWMDRPPLIGQLISNGAKLLLEGIESARAWKASSRPKLVVVPTPEAPQVTAAQRAEALAALRARRG